MANLQDRNGTQIGRLAHKVIRGVQYNRLTATELYARSREWRKLSKAVRRAESADIAALPLRSLQFAGSGISARWLAPRELRGIGHVIGNCLANEPYLEGYRTRLTHGEIEIVLLEDSDAHPLMLLSIDLESRAVSDFDVVSPALSLAGREALIALLCREKFEAGVNDGLLGLAICDQLLEARARTLSMRLRIEDRDCEIGPNFVAVVTDDTTILLRGPTCDDTNSGVCVVAPESPDTAYLARARARQWFRRTCSRDAVFAQACREAFAGADPAFCFDWFA